MCWRCPSRCSSAAGSASSSSVRWRGSCTDGETAHSVSANARRSAAARQDPRQLRDHLSRLGFDVSRDPDRHTRPAAVSVRVVSFPARRLVAGGDRCARGRALSARRARVAVRRAVLVPDGDAEQRRYRLGAATPAVERDRAAERGFGALDHVARLLRSAWTPTDRRIRSRDCCSACSASPCWCGRSTLVRPATWRGRGSCCSRACAGPPAPCCSATRRCRSDRSRSTPRSCCWAARGCWCSVSRPAKDPTGTGARPGWSRSPTWRCSAPRSPTPRTRGCSSTHRPTASPRLRTSTRPLRPCWAGRCSTSV